MERVGKIVTRNEQEKEDIEFWSGKDYEFKLDALERIRESIHMMRVYPSENLKGFRRILKITKRS